MMTGDRNWDLPELPTFALESAEVAPGAVLPQWARSGILRGGGDDRSPALQWSGAPVKTKSFVLTVYDPDAPGGFWHWAVYNLPGTLTALPGDAGNPDASLLPDGAITLPNELRLERFLGAAPPAGHGPHWYYFTLTALDVDKLKLARGSSPDDLGVALRGHAIGRGQFYATSETPPA